MFVMIHEDQTMVLLKDLTEDDKTACDDGVVALIDVSVADKPSVYIGGDWVDINPVH